MNASTAVENLLHLFVTTETSRSNRHLPTIRNANSNISSRTSRTEPGLQLSEIPAAFLPNHLTVRRNSLTQECRLRKPALTHMQRLLAGQQALAQHNLRSLHHNAAMMLTRIP